MKFSAFLSSAFIFWCSFLLAQQKTYCNPINIDYGYTPFKVFSQLGKHRATADPVIVNFQKKTISFFNESGRILVQRRYAELEICVPKISARQQIHA